MVVEVDRSQEAAAHPDFYDGLLALPPGVESVRMACVVRALREDELRSYVEIVNTSITSLAATHYTHDVIANWVVPVTDDTLADLVRNEDNEIRLVAELNGQLAGIGALVRERSELRACYVLPTATRQGVGTALVTEIEAIARTSGLDHLELAASLNAEPFYAALGYSVLKRGEVVLGNGFPMDAVWMKKTL
jgi:GNAT superfamily N-acetyltransferase